MTQEIIWKHREEKDFDLFCLAHWLQNSHMYCTSNKELLNGFKQMSDKAWDACYEDDSGSSTGNGCGMSECVCTRVCCVCVRCVCMSGEGGRLVDNCRIAQSRYTKALNGDKDVGSHSKDKEELE